LFILIITKLVKLNRVKKQLLMVVVDSLLSILTLLCAFSLRLDYWYWPKDEIALFIFGAPIIAVPVFIGFKLYYSVIRYMGPRALWSVAQASSFYALTWGLLSYMLSVEGIPRSVILINWMLTIIAIGGVRLIVQWLVNYQSIFKDLKKTYVIIYGAGSAGRELSHSLNLSDEYIQVAYIDDDDTKDKTYINNIPVFSNSKIKSLIKKNNVSEILLALPSVSRKKRRKIINDLNQFPVHVRSLPSVSELAEGKIKIDDLLEIDVRDLLGRESVKPNKKFLKTNITNKVVLVSGAGGSIGSELCRQIFTLKPKILVLFELSESSLYQIEQELLQLGETKIELHALLGSVRDKGRIESILKRFSVQTIYHAAAYKHVPLVEYNQSEGVLNNSIGTMIFAEVAIKLKVETFVLISTDKAVRPTNTMGASKRIAELILQGLAHKSHSTCFSMVRFGNVLDSSGSVIPLFRKQIKKGGPVTVTDKKIVRYFMTISEAVELVIQSGAMGKGGDVFVLDMGEPILIYDLAVKMIQLSGLSLMNGDNQDGDIEIQYTGLRPGEKLYEELLIGKNVKKTDNKLIMSAKEEFIEWDILQPILVKLEDVALNSNQRNLMELLTKLVPEFIPHNKE